jgi:hypothetical protein
MFEKLYSLFATNAYQELSAVAQIMNAILQTFMVNKFSDGETGRDAAINALITQLQSHLSNNAAQPTPPTNA